MESHFFDGDCPFTIQRHRHMKRRDVEAMIAAVVEDNAEIAERRGVRDLADVI